MAKNDKPVGGGGRADETVVDLSKSLKSQRIIKNQKISKAWKVAKVIGLEEYLSKYQFFGTLIQKLELPL